LRSKQAVLYASREERPGNNLKAGNRLLYAILSREEEREPENTRRLSAARISNSATKVNVHTVTVIIQRRRIRINFCPTLRLFSKRNPQSKTVPATHQID
jgi:hypothetical protein